MLFDGIPINDAWGEWIDWGRVPKAMLDRVEVVEGGTSSLYGNGAMGGVISFFSRPLSPGAMNLQIDGGSRSARHGYAAAGIPIFSGLSANVMGDYQEKGGYVLIDPAKAEQWTSRRRLSSATRTDVSIMRRRQIGPRLPPAISFGDSRGTGTPLSRANREQKNLDLGLNYGIDAERYARDPRLGRSCRPKRSVRPRFVPVAARRKTAA